MVFLVGCIGSVAPEVIKARKAEKFTVEISLGKTGIFVAFVVVSGFVAFLWTTVAPTNLFQAFYYGLTADVLISTLAAKPPSLPAPPPAPLTGLPPTSGPSTPQVGGTGMPLAEGPQGLSSESVQLSRVPIISSSRQYLWLLTGSASERKEY